MSPAGAILASFGVDPTSLIVMATHGRVGLARVVLGSVAAEVVRKARGPVAVFHPDQLALNETAA